MKEFSLRHLQIHSITDLVHRWNHRSTLFSLIRTQAALRLHNRITKYGTIVEALLHDDPRLPRQFRKYAKELSLREAQEAYFNHVMDSALLAMQTASIVSGPLCFAFAFFTNSALFWPLALTSLVYLSLFSFLSFAIRNWSNEPVRHPSYVEETYFSDEEAKLLPTFAEAGDHHREIQGLFFWFAAISVIAIIWRTLQPVFTGAGTFESQCHTIFGFCILLAALGWSSSTLFIHSLRSWFNILSETLFAHHPIIQLVDRTQIMLHRLGSDLFREENRWSDIAFRNRAVSDLDWIIELLKMPARRFAPSKKRHAPIVQMIRQMQNEIDEHLTQNTPDRLHDLLSELFIHSTLGTMGTLQNRLTEVLSAPVQQTQGSALQDNSALVPKLLPTATTLIATASPFIFSLAFLGLGFPKVLDLSFLLNDWVRSVSHLGNLLNSSASIVSALGIFIRQARPFKSKVEQSIPQPDLALQPEKGVGV